MVVFYFHQWWEHGKATERHQLRCSQMCPWYGKMWHHRTVYPATTRGLWLGLRAMTSHAWRVITLRNHCKFKLYRRANVVTVVIAKHPFSLFVQKKFLVLSIFMIECGHHGVLGGFTLVLKNFDHGSKNRLNAFFWILDDVKILFVYYGLSGSYEILSMQWLEILLERNHTKLTLNQFETTINYNSNFFHFSNIKIKKLSIIQ